MSYERPEIIATYSAEELAADAAVCTGYGHTYNFKKWWWW